MRAIMLAAFAVLTLTACEDDYQSQERRLVSLVADSPMGIGGDYWLETRGITTREWYKVALFFGSVGDYEVCMEAAEALGSTVYRCTAAN